MRPLTVSLLILLALASSASAVQAFPVPLLRTLAPAAMASHSHPGLDVGIGVTGNCYMMLTGDDARHPGRLVQECD